MAFDPEGARFRLGEARGHYESWFLRGNHPSRALAFWLRYTVFSPKNRPQDAYAELYAIVFDGERARHVATREKHPLTEAFFPTSGLGVRIGASRLDEGHATGSARGPGQDAPTITWELVIRGGDAPLLLLPEKYYDGGFPKAKSLVMRPGVSFSGYLLVDGERVDVTGWRGSLNHNWGVRHTDRYAWGQVIGFPGAHDTVLEVATARIALGPVLSPAMTPIVLRHRGHEYRLNDMRKLFGRAKVKGLDWSFKARGDGIELRGAMRMGPPDAVTLIYENPPGGAKICINTKIASCRLEIRTASGAEELFTPSGAAFELLVDALADTGVDGLPSPI